MRGMVLWLAQPSAVAGLTPAFSTCLFHAVPMVPGVPLTAPVVPYGKIKLVLSVFIYLWGPECNYWIALMYYKFN